MPLVGPEKTKMALVGPDKTRSLAVPASRADEASDLVLVRPLSLAQLGSSADEECKWKNMVLLHWSTWPGSPTEEYTLKWILVCTWMFSSCYRERLH